MQIYSFMDKIKVKFDVLSRRARGYVCYARNHRYSMSNKTNTKISFTGTIKSTVVFDRKVKQINAADDDVILRLWWRRQKFYVDTRVYLQGYFIHSKLQLLSKKLILIFTISLSMIHRNISIL